MGQAGTADPLRGNLVHEVCSHPKIEHQPDRAKNESLISYTAPREPAAELADASPSLLKLAALRP
jgi:hypothetical protein